MKKILNQILLLTAVMATFTACEKDENRITYEGGTNPVLSANKVDNIPMSFPTKDNEAVTFSWTNPDYRFTTGVSSQDVTYTLEMDTLGANFSSPNIVRASISKDLRVTYKQSQINDFLLNQLALNATQSYDVEVRVISSLFNNNSRLISNTLRFNITPYAIPPKVNPPSSGKLFITGSATPASWQCGCGEPELLSQKFTQLSPTLFELPSINITGGGSYLLLPVYGSWAAKYGFTGAGNANNVLGDDFKEQGNDFKAPNEGGLYKITVDFQRGKTTLVKL
jgi:hypothetical protein